VPSAVEAVDELEVAVEGLGVANDTGRIGAALHAAASLKE